VTVVAAVQALSVPGGCEFPADWQGKWFESGVGDVIVTSHNVSRKGFCLENIDDFYLLKNQYAGKTETNSGQIDTFYRASAYCPSVCLSVRDTLVLYENGLTYRHSFSTIR